MKCSIIDRSTTCFDHLATPLQHTVDQSLYATLIKVGPGPLQNALEFLQRDIVPSRSCWLSAWCYPRGSLARSPDCNPIEILWDNIKQKTNKKVKDNTSLEEFQRILQKGPGPTWINFACKLWLTGDRSRCWIYQLLNTSFIVMLIKIKTLCDMRYIFFTPFVMKCMISHQQCHQLADIYHSFFA